MAGAFQSGVFQTNAFQTDGEASGPQSREITPSGTLLISGASLIGGFRQRTVVTSGGTIFSGVASVGKMMGIGATGGIGFSGFASVVRSGIVKEGAFNDLFIGALRAIGVKGFNLYDYWKSLSDGSKTQLNDIKKSVLRGMGYTGSLNDMEKKYWESQ